MKVEPMARYRMAFSEIKSSFNPDFENLIRDEDQEYDPDSFFHSS
jgi:hypothetical protein